MPNTPGYSGTPLAKKLGIVTGSRVLVVNEPAGYRDWLAPLPDDVTIVKRFSRGIDIAHLFTTSREELASKLTVWREKLAPDRAVWVSWPKRASKVATEVTEDVIREVALPMGWVDVKVCAVSETWSGLKLVVRVQLRSDQARSRS